MFKCTSAAVRCTDPPIKIDILTSAFFLSMGWVGGAAENICPGVRCMYTRHSLSEGWGFKPKVLSDGGGPLKGYENVRQGLIFNLEQQIA